jgi:hypothetical protein
MKRTRFALVAVPAVIVSLLSAASGYASRPSIVENEAVLKLQRGAPAGEKLVVERIPLFDGNPATITLERFEVWAPDVQIIEYGDGGKETRIPRPATKFYRGRINDDPGSLIFMSVHPNGEISGMALAGDGLRKLSIGRGVRRSGPPVQREPGEIDREAPLLSREFDEVDDLLTTPNGGFQCDVERAHMSIAGSLAGLKTKVDANTPPSTSTAYGLNLAIETDFELYQGFGSSGALTTYLGNLIGQASVIYQRDIKTTLTVGTTHIYSTASDPWTVLPASGTSAALAELGTYWHNNYLAVPRSAVVMVSGKTFSAGVAWENIMCQADFFCGVTGSNCGSATYANSYAGPYAFCGSTVVTTTVPDPTLTVNTIQYALPNNNNFWMLLEVAHELGHNANGEHTHCISTASTSYSGVRPYVDLCYNGEGGCYGGAQSYPPELGTIMSYCHNLFTTLNNPPGAAAGFRASRYIFGKAGEPSELQFPNFTTGLEAGTPNGAITVGSNLPCSAGQTASVAATSTYAWQISGGSITAGTNSATVTFTPSAPSVTLTVTAADARGCSITSQRITTSQCGGLTAPTNVVATATTSTSVSVTWTASGGATSYEVVRSANGTTYSSLGTTASTGFTDNTAAASTAYLYKVRAVAPSTSAYSTVDLATTVIFTDPTLAATSTPIKLAHFNELRTAIGAVRTLAVLGAYPYTTPTLTAGLLVMAVDLTDMRTALNAARSAVSLSAIGYTDPTIIASSTAISTAHINDLRNGVQ